MSRALHVAEELQSSGRWSKAMQNELDRSFEHAAVGALRRAALYERSVKLRHLARLVVPTALRPAVKRTAALVNRIRGQLLGAKSEPR